MDTKLSNLRATDLKQSEEKQVAMDDLHKLLALRIHAKAWTVEKAQKGATKILHLRNPINNLDS